MLSAEVELALMQASPESLRKLADLPDDAMAGFDDVLVRFNGAELWICPSPPTDRSAPWVTMGALRQRAREIAQPAPPPPGEVSDANDFGDT